MSEPVQRAAGGDPDRLLLALGMSLWVLALAVRWPLALSFGDEVGYVGLARRMLQGHLRPLLDSPGVWIETAGGRVSLYPPLLPLLIAPLLAVAPRLIFGIGVAAALMLTWVASRVLRAWGRSPLWALLLLAHPTVVLIARTVMADLLLAALAVGAWWALCRRWRVTAVALLALLVAVKPIGVAIALALAAGDAVAARRAGSMARAVPAVLGLAAGCVLTVTLNLITSGKPWFVYVQVHQNYGEYLKGVPSFSPVHWPKTAPAHAAWLLALPPLLIAGVWPLWRRRAIGPLLATGGLTLVMCSYFFVDRGQGRLDTLVLAPRLLLPALAFLMIGYADGVAALAARLPRMAPVFSAGLVLAPALLGLAVSTRHRRWQEPSAAALPAAAEVSARLGVHELAITGEAAKVGLLYHGPVSLMLRGSTPPLVLCNSRSESYRAPEGSFDCALPGYVERFAGGGFHVLARATP